MAITDLVVLFVKVVVQGLGERQEEDDEVTSISAIERKLMNEL